jgi:hypothetical protein
MLHNGAKKKKTVRDYVWSNGVLVIDNQTMNDQMEGILFHFYLVWNSMLVLSLWWLD